MRVLFSSNKNPFFESFTEYILKAFQENGCEVVFFENRDYTIPGRIRDRVPKLHSLDLNIMNKRLLRICENFNPDLFIEAGGWNILPKTIERLKSMGITTALWTVDPPRIFDEIIAAAPHYDFVFCQGTEAIEILSNYRQKHLYWMPFACDPDFHQPVKLSDEEYAQYQSDICFVGSGWSHLYPQRHELLEYLTDFDLSIWGPGWYESKNPKLLPFVKKGFTKPDEWIKIFSAAKIVFHSHFKDPEGLILCYQASPRVYEVLACGSFLLVDNQPDVLTLFKDKVHLGVFQSGEELRQLAEYYIKNESERLKIAKNGRDLALSKHTFKHRINDILTTIKENT